MEAGGESLHGGESHHHQPLELAAGPHLGPGVSHQTADGHLQADSRQQGQNSSSQRLRGHTLGMLPAFISPVVWLWPRQGSVELGGVAPCPVPAGGTEVKTEPVSTQVNMAQLPASWCTVSQGSHRDFEVIGAFLG